MSKLCATPCDTIWYLMLLHVQTAGGTQLSNLRGMLLMVSQQTSYTSSGAIQKVYCNILQHTPNNQLFYYGYFVMIGWVNIQAVLLWWKTALCVPGKKKFYQHHPEARHHGRECAFLLPVWAVQSSWRVVQSFIKFPLKDIERYCILRIYTNTCVFVTSIVGFCDTSSASSTFWHLLLQHDIYLSLLGAGPVAMCNGPWFATWRIGPFMVHLHFVIWCNML